jgi:hypothetical protein
MYSPKISEDLIPLLYQLRLKEKKPMTKIVDELLRTALSQRGEDDERLQTTEKTRGNHGQRA